MIVGFLLCCFGLLVLGTYRLGTAARNAACDAIVDLLDVGGAGSVKVYTSTQPGSVGGAYGTLLGTLTFASTAFGASSTGTATAASITSDTNADASGTAGTFTLNNNAGTVHSDGTCGTSGADMNFDNNVIVTGGTIAISSLTVTQPIS